MESIPSHLKRLIREIVIPVRDPFDRDAGGLSLATATPVVELKHGDTYNLQAAPVAKQIGEHTVKMLAYNGSIPGPTLRVLEGTEVVVHFTNLTEVEATVHWHGLRLDPHFDGVPQHHGGMQPPVPTGGSFTYRLRFPDPGLFWYHPHIREDYTQEHGLYGNILILPADAQYWGPVNREVTLVVDDILMERGKVAPFSRSGPTHAVTGRFGNVMLVNGETAFLLPARHGEVVRLYLSNMANVRIFNLHIPGARMKLTGGDSGRVEREAFVESILIAPSERVVVDVLFEQAGHFPIEHYTSEKTYQLGTVAVGAEPATPSYASDFYNLRRSQELEAVRAEVSGDFDREPDKTIALIGETIGTRPAPSTKENTGQTHVEETEWDDSMALHRGISYSDNIFWQIVDRATGKANLDIDWVFESGPRVKIQIENPSDSDHPMPHPMHFHGQRFLVLRRDGLMNDNLVWKDSVLVKSGEKVDILLDTSNRGTWMAHCHIAEHVEVGMMFNFLVKGKVGNGDIDLQVPALAENSGPISSDGRNARAVAATVTLRENEFWIRDVPPGHTTLVHVNGEDIAVYNVAGTYYATQNQCTHARGPLNEGVLEGACIVCPWHRSRFDVRDGKVFDGPAIQPLKTYRVIVEGEIGRVK